MADAVLFSEKEREVLHHATGWNSGQALFRNHFCTSPEGDDWETIQALCVRGLMRIGRKPSALSGGDTIFVVTDAGIEGLRADATPAFVERTCSVRARPCVESIERPGHCVWCHGRMHAAIENAPRAPSLVEQLAKRQPIDGETATWSGADAIPWLVKDFDVLYRSAEAALEALPDVGDRRADAIGALRTQLRRLRPAFEQCQAVRALARGKEG